MIKFIITFTNIFIILKYWSRYFSTNSLVKILKVNFLFFDLIMITQTILKNVDLLVNLVLLNLRADLLGAAPIHFRQLFDYIHLIIMYFDYLFPQKCIFFEWIIFFIIGFGNISKIHHKSLMKNTKRIYLDFKFNFLKILIVS